MCSKFFLSTIIGIVHPKVKMWSSFAYSTSKSVGVYSSVSSVEHKGRYLEE